MQVEALLQQAAAAPQPRQHGGHRDDQRRRAAVLVDDNNHYSSMRHELYQLARQSESPASFRWLPCAGWLAGCTWRGR
jgi:hypothetical protein